MIETLFPVRTNPALQQTIRDLLATYVGADQPSPVCRPSRSLCEVDDLAAALVRPASRFLGAGAEATAAMTGRVAGVLQAYGMRANRGRPFAGAAIR